jgi:hypothetical protein
MAHIRQSRPDSGTYKTVKARFQANIAHIRQSSPEGLRGWTGPMTSTDPKRPDVPGTPRPESGLDCLIRAIFARDLA